MQPITMLPKLTDTTQTISFSEGDGVSSSEVYATDVVVNTNAGTHNHGSSKVKLKNLVDYNWEPKFYAGQLLAIHMTGKYLAYSIKAPNASNPGSWNGMVRVVFNPEPGTDRRALIKGMKGEVQDLAFAHIQNQVVLASIDEHGNFYVHEIESTDTGLRCSLVAEQRSETPSAGHRVVWCPYIPDDDDSPDDDVARLLLTTHDNIARMWNIRGGVAGGGAGAAGGGAWGAEHAAPLVDAAFSPDGTALATAAADGYVMFYQVYMHNESSPRCLHKWQPHAGKPLSCLFFLDNHKNYNTDVQFWKFAVTGADSNTVIKIWSCKSWNCLQTINFTPSPGSDGLGLKASLDTSASYLILSDFRARSLYVLNMARDSDDTAAYCRSISEFLLPYPVLSFCIVDAEEELAKCESSCDDPFHRNGSGDDALGSPDDFDLHDQEDAVKSLCGGGDTERRVRILVYIVQPKGLQEGELVYAQPAPALPPPPPPPPAPAPAPLVPPAPPALTGVPDEPEPPALASSILQQQSQQLKNLLMRTQTQPGSLIVQRAESPPLPPPLNLMTPDAFSSPGKREEDDPPLSATPDVPAGLSVTEAPLVTSGSGSVSGSGNGPARDLVLPSAGSSPSREVQQIMANDADYYTRHMDTEAEEEEEVEAPEIAAIVPPEPSALPPVAVPVTNDVTLTEHNMFHATNDRGSESSWPQISLAQLSEAHQRKGADKPPPDARLDALYLKLDKLTELVSAQSRELRTLRSEMQSGRQVVDAALTTHATRTAACVSDALAAGWDRIARIGETASARAASSAGLGAARALEPLCAALQHELAAKLSATDVLLRDNIEKLAHSKTIMERLSTSIATSLSEMVRASLRDALAERALPAMEKANAQMFRQLNQAFQNGTKEFVANTSAAARVAAERGGAAAIAGLQAALERHAAALAAAPAPAPAAAPHPPPPSTHELTVALQHVTHSVLEKELAWWRSQAIRTQPSRSHSPAAHTVHSSQSPQQERQMQVAQIQSLLSGGDMNGAFQLALSASDLALVVLACRGAEPAAVFGPPCRLRQHVLLSLVQQLAADMSRDTALKHRYLEEAIMNLDTSSPVTREHLPGVVRDLKRHVQAFLAAQPAHALAKQLRVLLMAADSLLHTA